MYCYPRFPAASINRYLCEIPSFAATSLIRSDQSDEGETHLKHRHHLLPLRGIARHCNYLGDLLVALSFSLPCGTSSPVPYLYPIYLLILLIWRKRRDEARCAEKYREIWAEFHKIVPWRILPYVC